MVPRHLTLLVRAHTWKVKVSLDLNLSLIYQLVRVDPIVSLGLETGRHQSTSTSTGKRKLTT